tara:strand:- start:45 stop:530 length:486 start_codon:yes stop_codon:yes gene_type:complete
MCSQIIYIIQAKKNKINFDICNKDIVSWVAHNPRSSQICIDKLINMCGNNPIRILRNFEPITIYFVSKVLDIIDIIEHAIRKGKYIVTIVRLSLLNKLKSKIVNIPSFDNSNILKIDNQYNILDAFHICNKNNFFRKYINLLNSCTNLYELDKGINNLKHY